MHNLSKETGTSFIRSSLSICSLIDALVLIITEDFIKVNQFTYIIKLAKSHRIPIVLVDNVELENFPSFKSIYSIQDSEVQSIFSSCVASYFASDNDPMNCWAEIYDSIDHKAMELKRVKDTFFIYKGAIGHHIALLSSLILNPSRDDISIPLTRQETRSLLLNSIHYYYIVTPESLTDNDCLKGKKVHNSKF